MAWDLKQCNLDITVYSDASGGWGCGAFADELWFQLEWPPQAKDFSIAIKGQLKWKIHFMFYNLDMLV